MCIVECDLCRCLCSPLYVDNVRSASLPICLTGPPGYLSFCALVSRMVVMVSDLEDAVQAACGVVNTSAGSVRIALVVS